MADTHYHHESHYPFFFKKTLLPLFIDRKNQKNIHSPQQSYKNILSAVLLTNSNVAEMKN